ncbi:4-hydroxy-tetrahydrodipicolinate reductase [Brumimicrobium salinarum]|uniref:4-hydroxy-tetrahydrodipicolinate reductase n=1 Tax=Brumimicrobium salinarum TaxID=2058658 RepID=A0A2I0R572_9FLAO|nr:4-hydroxy-tetrahydrodipicolinate reductase [Brumimicrobium salinarum]PKR81736.1 4-hydroxy-tetrahydrodipicolinate reductase [Brumimicrobium salinarum]
MKIILVGYGKMGKEIERIALERGHEIVGKATAHSPLCDELISDIDVAIDFSTPDSVISNINFLLSRNIPSVIGTTGWHDAYKAIENKVKNTNGALVHASNFSVGVNLFFKLNEQLARLMQPYTDYKAEISEIHHTEKKDAPSGTAITLAKGIIENNTTYTDWICPQSEKLSQRESNDPHPLPIEAIRKADVKGTHTLTYSSTIDTISIKHEAHNRKGFALGAVIAAEWIKNKKGIFTMKDVLDLS